MDEQRRQTLQWLTNQYFEEIRSLREAEDNLFNLTISAFLAGFGALTGLRGVSDASWSITWRLVIWAGIIVATSVVIFMAWLLRGHYRRHEDQIASIIKELDPGTASVHTVAPEENLFFSIRWGAIALMSVILMGLVWMLG